MGGTVRVPSARFIQVLGFAVHLASLLLPFGSFKCDAPQPFFSLECALPGLFYLALPLSAPSADRYFAIASCWALAIGVGLLAAATRRLRRTGWFAWLALPAAFLAAMLVAPPSRWLGPVCAILGQVLILAGGVLGVVSRATRTLEGTPART
jgi:hypothetical protein